MSKRWGWVGFVCLVAACGGDDGTTCPDGMMVMDGRCVMAFDGGGDTGPCDPTTAEACNGVDDDCDGTVDENVTQACGLTMEGQCTMGTETCVDGMFEGCDAVEPVDEVCGDGLDDDCDGAVDERCMCTPGESQACGSEVGECMPGVQVCGDDMFFGTCDGAVGSSAEVCDGLDNDCNGVVDNGNPGGGGACGTSVGACLPGIEMCLEGAIVCMGGVSATDEVCNDVDDDCDGMTDEGVLLEWYPDMDGDGFGDSTVGAVLDCETPPALPGAVNDNTDCDDDCAACTPGAVELCDGLNNDCDDDSNIDEGIGSCVFGDDVSCVTTCGSTGTGTCNAMCEPPDDSAACDPPEESCNFADVDCDGIEDEDTREIVLSAALSSGFDDADEVRIVPIATGFLAVVLHGRRIDAQRLSTAGVPTGSSLKINIANDVDNMDIDVFNGDRVVVAWTRTGDELAAAVLRARSTGITFERVERIIDADAEQFGDVAVAANESEIVFAYGNGIGALGDTNIRLARTTTALGGVNTTELLQPLAFARKSALDLIESAGTFTLAFENGASVRTGTVTTTAGNPNLPSSSVAGTCEHPVLGERGDGERVLGCVSGSELLSWTLNASSAVVGAPTRMTNVVPAISSGTQTHRVAFSGGAWIWGGAMTPAAGFNNFIGTRETDVALANVGAASVFFGTFEGADVAADGAGNVVGIIANTGSSTRVWVYSCP